MENNMGKITLSLSKEADKKLRERAEKNFRSISKEVEAMLQLLEEKEK